MVAVTASIGAIEEWHAREKGLTSVDFMDEEWAKNMSTPKPGGRSVESADGVAESGAEGSAEEGVPPESASGGAAGGGGAAVSTRPNSPGQLGSQSRLTVQGVFAQAEAAGGSAPQGSDQPEPAPQPAPAPAPAPASGGDSPHGHSVTPKKVEAQVWGGFACPACTFENDASAQVCGMCETPRPQED